MRIQTFLLLVLCLFLAVACSEDSMEDVDTVTMTDGSGSDNEVPDDSSNDPNSGDDDSGNSFESAIIYNGPGLVFEKVGFADPTEAQNQDRITDNVWLTRANRAGLFNAAVETAYTEDVSPEDTEWAEGTLADLQDLEFSDWRTAVDANPRASVNKTYILHLITDDIYIEVTFLSWGQRNDGANFSYERSTPPN